jgi:hypothetical protein
MSFRTLSTIGFASVLLTNGAQRAFAQAGAGRHDDHVMNGATAAMTGPMRENPHLRLTPTRQATAADRRRADSLVATLREALAPYHDVEAAERDGYRLFLPELENQPVFHYTNWRHAASASFRFAADKPTSLLYERASDGKMKLVGAMYTAPKNASLEDLDERVPLSIARWHLHTNICVPPRGEEERWRELEGGKMRFGPAGTIASEAACHSVGGRFIDTIFNWMVHANVFETDAQKIWGEHHSAGGHSHR